MRIEREALLGDLELVRPGLSPREFIEQSACFVFQNGHVITFNDEVSCRKKTAIQSTGAVAAKALLEVLHKVDDASLEVEDDGGEIQFKGNGKRFGVAVEKEISLPIDRVEMPENWHPFEKRVIEAVGMVQHCVGKDESKFITTCVHLFPNGVESCDNRQMMRCSLPTGLKKSVIVRGTSIAHICVLAMDKIALTQSWLHFTNSSGLILSCRRYDEQFPDLSSILSFKGEPTSIPKDLAKVCDRASIFAEGEEGAEPLVSVSLIPGKLKIVGEGHAGWYKEIKNIVYDGPPLDFCVAPELLRHIGEKYSDAEVGQDRLKVKGGNWTYITALRPNRKEK